jgi:chaperone BCS1
LSFALAGIFGLEIYAISLQEPSLTEGDLLQLFNGLPRRCIVLLEDVDAAGLLRDSQSDDKEKKKSKNPKTDEDKKAPVEKPKKEEEYTLKDLAKELKAISVPKSKGNSKDNNNQHQATNPNRLPGAGISLSGLLNAIDGVATHEGRVLIMTTNHPEKLDAALVRPGRVDRRIEFNLAKRDQIRELFVRMYAGDEKASTSSNHLANGTVINGHAKKSNGSASLKSSRPQHTGLTDDDLHALAIEFAGHIPDDTFTPAELQNLLMRHKKEPKVAVEKADAWVKEILAEKEKAEKEKEERENGSDDDDDE